MATLPVSLQKAIRGNEVSVAIGDNTIRTEMAVGATRVRRRSSFRVDVMPIPMTVTVAELAVFESFFSDTIRDGSLPFYMTHPVKGGSVKVRFDKNRYTFKTIGSHTFHITSSVEILE